MSTNQVNCQNCEKPFEDGFEFCPHCGQKTNEELTIGVLFYNTISNYFSFDARFLKSFFPLMFKPGNLAKQFLNGKRLLYLHPAQMYLFISVIFFFIFSFYIRDSRAELDKSMQDVLSSRSEKSQKLDSIVSQDSLSMGDMLEPIKDNSVMLGLNEEELKALDSVSNIKIPKKNIGTSFSFNEKEMDSLIAIGATNGEIYKYMGMDENAGFIKRKFYSQILKFYKEMGLGQIYQTFIDSIPIAMFFLLPIFAFLLKLFFFNKGRYAHHLVFGFYYFSFLFLVLSIVFGVNLFWDIPDWIDWLVALSTFFYFLFAIINFYGQNWFLSIIKSGLISFLFLLLILPLSMIILGIISFMFY